MTNKTYTFIGFCILYLRLAGAEIDVSSDIGVLDWSTPRRFIINSDHGNLGALKTSSPLVTSRYGHRLALVSSSEVYGALLSDECDSYCVVSNKIVGLRVFGDKLEFLWSNINTEDGNETSLQTIAQIIKQIESGAEHCKSTRYSIPYLFSDFRFGPPPTAKFSRMHLLIRGGDIGAPTNNAPVESYVVTRCQHEAGNISVYIQSNANRLLQVVINESLELVSAYLNGSPIRLLSSGNADGFETWSPPSRRYLIKPDGRSLIQSRSRTVKNSKSSVASENFTSVWAEDGSVWIGPSECEIILFANSILGVCVDKQNIGSIRIYKSSIVLSNGIAGTKLFEQHLREFDDSIESGKGDGLQPIAIGIASAFPSETNLLTQELNIRTVRHFGDNIEIILTTIDPNQNYSILVDTNLTAIGGKFVGYDYIRENKL